MAKKSVTKLLLCNYDEVHLDVMQGILECVSDDLDFLKILIIGDQCLVYCYLFTIALCIMNMY